MAIGDIKKDFGGGMREKSEKMPSPSSKKEKPDTSIFGGKPDVSARGLREKLIKASPYIPDAGGAMYCLSERKKLAEEITKKYGTFFEKEKFEDTMMFRDLRRQKSQAKTGVEKLAIDRKIRFLKREIEGEGK